MAVASSLNFSSFLFARKQRVVLGSHISDWTDVNSSVPQGSILGPTLFIFYINDLVDSLSNPSLLYADDTKVFGKISSSNPLLDSFNLQQDIDKINEWTQIWLMSLNVSECKLMHFVHKNPRTNYFLDGHELV